MPWRTLTINTFLFRHIDNCKDDEKEKKRIKEEIEDVLLGCLVLLVFSLLRESISSWVFFFFFFVVIAIIYETNNERLVFSCSIYHAIVSVVSLGRP